jgi:hypothetical protein
LIPTISIKLELCPFKRVVIFDGNLAWSLKCGFLDDELLLSNGFNLDAGEDFKEILDFLDEKPEVKK